jgi:hypothetical protein
MSVPHNDDERPIAHGAPDWNGPSPPFRPSDYTHQRDVRTVWAPHLDDRQSADGRTFNDHGYVFAKENKPKDNCLQSEAQTSAYGIPLAKTTHAAHGFGRAPHPNHGFGQAPHPNHGFGQACTVYVPHSNHGFGGMPLDEERNVYAPHLDNGRSADGRTLNNSGYVTKSEYEANRGTF